MAIGNRPVDILTVPCHVAAAVLQRGDILVEPVVGKVLHGVQPRQDQPHVGIELVAHVGLDSEAEGDVVVEYRPEGVDLLAETVAAFAVVAVEPSFVDLILVFHLVRKTEGELLAGIVEGEVAIDEVVEPVVGGHHPCKTFPPAFFGDDIDDAAGAFRVVGSVGVRDDFNAPHVGGGDGVDGAEVGGHAVDEKQHVAVASECDIPVGINGHRRLAPKHVGHGATHQIGGIGRGDDGTFAGHNRP